MGARSSLPDPRPLEKAAAWLARVTEELRSGAAGLAASTELREQLLQRQRAALTAAEPGFVARRAAFEVYLNGLEPLLGTAACASYRRLLEQRFEQWIQSGESSRP